VANCLHFPVTDHVMHEYLMNSKLEGG